MTKRRGASYQKRVSDINRIYDEHIKSGISNREIWRRYVYPVYAVSERTFYNLLNAPSDPKNAVPQDVRQLLLFDFDDGPDDTENHKENT